MLLPRALFACSLPVLGLAHTFSLSDLQWTLRNEDGSITVPGRVPSQTHLDLWRAGVIEDPLRGITGEQEKQCTSPDTAHDA